MSYNNEFARINFCFRTACNNAGTPPTGRQAGKFRRGQGAAWSARPTIVDLGTLTVAKLREACEQSGITLPAKALKADIISLLRGE
mgnify:CR=1 FL=1